MSRLSLPRAFLIVSGLGFVLMIAFDTTVTRLLGVACIFAALALGVAAIATPEFLSADAEDEDERNEPPAAAE